MTVSDTAELVGLSRRSTGAIFLKILRRLAEDCERSSSTTDGEVEIGESHFGPKRVRGKRGRGAGGKTIVFGIFERQESVYTEIVPNVQKRTLQVSVRGRIDPEAIVYSDGWVGYDGLIDMGYQKHFRIRHREDHFADGRTSTASSRFGALLGDGSPSPVAHRSTPSSYT